MISFSTLIGNTELADANYSQLFINAVEWASIPPQPVPDAGPDKIICNQICDGVVLDGRKSYDPNGAIVSYDWELDHEEDLCDKSATGETPTVTDLCPGIYDVTLNVTDIDGLTDTDEMVLTVLETCDTCSIMQGDFDRDGDGDDLRRFSQPFGTEPLTP